MPITLISFSIKRTDHLFLVVSSLCLLVNVIILMTLAAWQGLFVLRRSHSDLFADGQDVPAVFPPVQDFVHRLLDQENSQSADLPFLRAQRHVRIRLLQRVKGGSAVREGNLRRPGRRVKREASDQTRGSNKNFAKFGRRLGRVSPRERNRRRPR